MLSPEDPFGTVIRGSNPDKYYSSLNGVYGALVAYNGGKVVVSGTNPDSLDLTTRYPFFSNEFTVTIYDAENETFINPVDVELGISDGLYVQILSGLQEGDTFWYAYYDTLDISTDVVPENPMGFSMMGM